MTRARSEDIAATLLVLDSLLWGKPAAHAALWRGPCGKGPSALINSQTSLPCTLLPFLGHRPSSPGRAFRWLQPWPVFWPTLWGTWLKTKQLLSLNNQPNNNKKPSMLFPNSWNCEIINIYCCCKPLNFGIICYVAIKTNKKWFYSLTFLNPNHIII